MKPHRSGVIGEQRPAAVRCTRSTSPPWNPTGRFA
jgi:hypothetical protein